MPGDRDVWALLDDKLLLLLGMTDKGRLGFAVQLKFRQVCGRYPESMHDIPPDIVQHIAEQVEVTFSYLVNYHFQDQQAQRHRQNIRRYLNVRLPDKADVTHPTHWLAEFILLLNPQALHGRELVTDWCNEQLIEPPAFDHLDRIIRSAVRRFDTEQQAIIFNRLSINSKVSINHLLSSEDHGSDKASGTSFSSLKADLGKPRLENVLSVISR